MTQKSLIGVVLLVGLAVLATGALSPIQGATKTDKTAESLADLRKKANDWQLRAIAMDTLITFESSTRKKFKGYCKLMTAYIEYIGKAAEYRKADIKVTVTPKGVLEASGKAEEVKALRVKLPDTPITFEQAMALSVEVVKAQGHLAIDVADAQETEMTRRVHAAKEKLARKVWSDTQMYYKKALSMKVYLQSIKQFEKCKEWAAEKTISDSKASKAEIERKRKAHKEAEAKKRAERIAAGKIKKEQEEREAKAATERLQQAAHERRLRSHEVRLKKIDSHTKIMSEKYRARGYWSSDRWW